jgi:putative lipoprotein
MSKFRIVLAIMTLAVVLTALPAAAQDDAAVPAVVSGTILLPEGAILPDGTVINIEIQETSRADTAAVTISALSMEAPGATSPVPFALSMLPEALEEQGDYTLSIRIESPDGTLLYINDWVIRAIDEGGPITDGVAELIAVQ